ncbi:MAG TPA: serine/threonine-protein kinase, partial [Gaiellaceae bacterium]
MSSALALQHSEPILGRYRPLRPLGSGGSGSVWLARDEKTGLDVALKIVAREGKAAARAEREASAAAKLRHPSCLRAYAFARDPRHVYIAYEFIPGRTFREALRAGELDDADAVEACAQVSEGLAHAHRSGILHRDVKPSNVLLAEGDRVAAKLLDFGLARMAEAETLTAQGDVPGTLAYISPERLAGDAATEAADVWAVGVMLWESLAGRHPFWHTSMLETARSIEAGAPSLATMRPDLPKQLIQLVDRALSPSPTRRPSAADLAAALRGAAAHRRRKRARALGISVPAEAGRLAAAGLASAFVAWTTASLPFYPHGWPIGLALIAAALTAFRPLPGLAFALAVPVLPLGNVSLGLAIVYGVFALAWLVLSWREPRGGLLFALGPLLAPLSALALVPLAAATLRAALRRAA